MQCARHWVKKFCPWMVLNGINETGLRRPWWRTLTPVGDRTISAKASKLRCLLVFLLLSHELFKIWWKSRGENKIYNNIIGMFYKTDWTEIV